MTKSKPTPKIRHLFWYDTIAVALFAASLLLLLALFSFDPGDISHFKMPPNDPALNYIGPVGAYIAALVFFSLGAAAYILPLIVTGLGLLMMLRPGEFNIGLKLLLTTTLLIITAAVVQLAQPIGFLNGLNPLQSKMAHQGMLGGWIGYLLHQKMLVPWIGTLGSAILLVVIDLSLFIFLFDVHPIALARQLIHWGISRYDLYQKQKLEMATPVERLAYQKKLLEKEQRALQKKLASKGVSLANGSNGANSSAEKKENLQVIPSRPASQVVDTTQLSASRSTSEEEDMVRLSGASLNSVKRSDEGGLHRKTDLSDKVNASEKSQRADKTSKAEKGDKKSSSSAALSGANISADYTSYTLPGVHLLTANSPDGRAPVSEAELRANQRILMESLAEFGVEVSPGDITRGATITRYELFPAPGVRVERIVSLEKNIARAMKAERINILAPIPGKDTVGVEVANNSKSKIVLRDLLESPDWRSCKARLPVAIGKDIYGRVMIDDLAEMPHLLIAGTTGSGKSVCINCLLLSLLYRFSPEDLRIILVDPKVVELQVYNTLPHLVVPVVTDPKKVLLALRWVINEMEKRYQYMAKAGVRNIAAYNARAKEKEKTAELDFGSSSRSNSDSQAASDAQQKEQKANVLPDKLPYIVVIIDELADLMQTTPADVENAIARLSAKARAAGIHLVIATQTPRASVITGVIKTNVPARIAFQVPSALDSRVILDENGAENLLGKGDLLYLRPGSSKLSRAQGAYVSEEEVSRVVEKIASQAQASYEVEIHQKLSRPSDNDENEISEKDEELIEKCMEVIRQEKRASTSLLQRRLKIGYGRAAWVIDQLEIRGIVGPKDGAKDREILVDLDKEQNGNFQNGSQES